MNWFVSITSKLSGKTYKIPATDNPYRTDDEKSAECNRMKAGFEADPLWGDVKVEAY